MRPFTYARADSTSTATSTARDGATFIAGGTNLLDLMKLEVMAPTELVDVNHLGLDEIEPTADGGLRIGALVSNSDCAIDHRVRRDYAVLSRALLAGASGQLRNKATMGGNLCQRTRCSYFYDTAMPCNKREPGSGCGAVGGCNRNHAILGASPACIATYPGDMGVALCALGAGIEIEAPDGERRVVPATDFHRLPDDTPHLDNELEAGELITAVLLPPPVDATHAYRKVRDRASYAFALVSVAAVVGVDERRITSAGIALGGVAHKPWRDPAVEAALVGEEPSPALFEHAADVLLADARGQGDNDFKIPLARRVLIAVLTEATAERGDAR